MATEVKKGQSVKFKTNQGRKGTGTVAGIRSTAKGNWIDITDSAGNPVSCRPVNVSPA